MKATGLTRTGPPSLLASRQPEQSLRITREDVCHVLVTNLCRLHLLQGRAALIARRIGVEETAEDQPMRAQRLDELPDVAGATNVRGVKENIRGPLRNLQDELAVHISRQRIH